MMRTTLNLIAVLLLSPAASLALGPTVVQSRLANGAQLLVSEQRNLPLVVIGIMVDAGSRWDPAGRAGVANLTADLLTEGNQ